MKSNHQGAILATALILLFVISLLAISALESAVLEIKMSHNQLSVERSFQAAEVGLSYAQQLLRLGKAQCNYSEHDGNYFSQQNSAWWQANACSLSNFKIPTWYLVEQLRSDPCAQILVDQILVDKSGKSAVSGVMYYRITVRSISQQSSSVILQSTLALPAKHKLACVTGGYRNIMPGRQSWREIV